jgi:hypothetical protein
VLGFGIDLDGVSSVALAGAACAWRSDGIGGHVVLLLKLREVKSEK